MLSRLCLAALIACLLAIGPATAKSASTENLYQAPVVTGEIGAQAVDASSENAFVYDDCAAGDSVYTWNSDNRLIEVKQGATQAAAVSIATYTYDANGNRVSKNESQTGKTTTYLVDSTFAYAQTARETVTQAGTTTATDYVWGNGLIGQSRAGQENYFHADGLGSVKTLTDGTGNVTDTYAYEAFGGVESRTGMTENAYRYTGEYFDEAINLQYNRARWYEPSIGRFVSEVVDYLNVSENRMRQDRVIQFKPDWVLIQDGGLAKCVWMPYAAIQIDSTSAQMSTPPSHPDRHEFAIGDTVSFEGRDLIQRFGIIVRINQKTATLSCDGQSWRVSFALLHHVVDL